jgi:UDP-N-acetylglucosamine--N-acetylmuramyl-(pentapeptide) pyrophosphoryl-undecaprenol N-acetylglucosamine transferase
VKIMLVCTVGGHLAQLFELQRRFVEPNDDVLWVTHDTPQSASLLVGARVTWLPYIRERDVQGVLRALPPAWRMLRTERPDLVVSTGSAIALAFLPLARMLGAHVSFIESAAMTNGRTRTGRVLGVVPGIDLYTQSLITAEGRWQFLGSVFDGFVATRGDSAVMPRRVVVTVGTSQEFGFRGLIERLQCIIPPRTEVLWQTGSTDLLGLDIEATPWLPAAELEAAMATADVVISHAGGGSALAALANGKRPILVPRRAAHGEFNDDHQEEITAQLELRELAIRGHLETLDWDDVVEAAQWSVGRASGQHRLPLRP